MSHQLETLKNCLGSIWDLLEGDVQEVMINGPDNVWVERHGRLEATNRALSKTEIDGAIHILGRMNRKDVNENTSDALIDARLEGFRIAACIQPISVLGPSISIRKHSPVIMTLDDYVSQGAINEEDKALLKSIVTSHKNCLVVGGTSSGKTTFLNALIKEIPSNERVITIEDTQELQVSVPNWVPFEANEQSKVTTRMLLKQSLRYRPDRILVGEVRGAEAYDLMQAANTGHDGVMATLHASSAPRGLTRFETLILTADVNWPLDAIRVSIADTFHYVMFLARRSGKRQLEQVLQMQGYDHVTEKYQYKLIIDRKEA